VFDAIGKDIRNFLVGAALVLVGLVAVIWCLVSAY
jgi:hypothetical protein